MYKFAYAIILKENGCCIQNIRTNKSGWSIETNAEFSIEIPVNSADDYLDKFYHDGKWWERVYNRYETIVQKDDDGNVVSEYVRPVEVYGYTETEMTV